MFRDSFELNWTKFRAYLIFLVLFLIIFSSMSLAVLSQSAKWSQVDRAGATSEVNGPEYNFIHSEDPITFQARSNGYNYTDVLVVYNGNSGLSVKIAKYFQAARDIPELNMVNLTNISAVETVSKTVFDEIRGQIEGHLDDNNLTQKINYIVTTKGVPLRVSGSTMGRACLDNELTMIKGSYQGSIGNSGWLINPYFQLDEPFSKSKLDLYLVTRLTGFKWEQIKKLIDNATASTGQRGTYVLDVDASKGYTGGYGIGNVWIRDANNILTQKGIPTFYDNTNTFVTGNSNVMGYASWGSNDNYDTSNYVVNYGFESNTTSLPNNWYPIYDPGITDSISVNSSESYSGSKSIVINRSVVSDNITGVAQNISITPQTRYYLRSRVKVSTLSGPGGAHIQVQTLDALDNILKVQNTNFRTGTTSSWVSFSQVIYEPNPSATKVRIIVLVNQSSGIVFFDHITFNDILPHFNWLPGAIAETFVSTGGRSFTYGTSYGQSLIADLIMDGVTGVKGYVYEPYLSAIAHPDILFDRYTDGYNLAESYYMASNFLGWMDVVVGDPKMAPYNDTLSDVNISIEGLAINPAIPDQDKKMEIKYTVSNIGNRGVDDVNIKVYVIVDGIETLIEDNTTSTTIDMGKDVTINFHYTPDMAGDVKIRVIVDPENTVKELDEYNNMVEREIHINHPPTAESLSVYPSIINRTETFYLAAIGADVETLSDNLEPKLETMHETLGTWFEFKDEQVDMYFESEGTQYWAIEIVSNKTMAVGNYSFRVMFIDENQAISNYFYRFYTLEVRNCIPTLDEIYVEKTILNRTENITIDCLASDVEDFEDEMVVEIEYRLWKMNIPIDVGWVTVDEVLFSGDLPGNFSPEPEALWYPKTYWWFCYIEFGADWDFGPYQIRARVRDTDLRYSSWEYYPKNITVLNNRPVILNFTAEHPAVFRNQELNLTISTFDVEDANRLTTLVPETQYSLNMENNWETEYLWDIQYNYDNSTWDLKFIAPATTPVGNYSFRTRFQDRDENWSAWYYLDPPVEILNNRPQAVISDLPETFTEDESFTMNARESTDMENTRSQLEYYWELSNSQDIIETNTNNKFTSSLELAGEYFIRLRVMDTDGAVGWDEKLITVVNLKPSAAITVDNQRSEVDKIVIFNAAGSSDTPSDIGGLTYTWDFGDNTKGNGKTVNHSYSTQGSYTVTLQVTDDDHATDNTTINIDVLRIIPPPPDEPEESDSTDQTSGILAGVGALIVIVIIVLILFFMVLRKRKKQGEIGSIEGFGAPAPKTEIETLQPEVSYTPKLHEDVLLQIPGQQPESQPKLEPEPQLPQPGETPIPTLSEKEPAIGPSLDLPTQPGLAGITEQPQLPPSQSTTTTMVDEVEEQEKSMVEHDNEQDQVQATVMDSTSIEPDSKDEKPEQVDENTENNQTSDIENDTSE
jgi:uncharacterized protein (TIGR03790 family)